jgi:D-alanyl-D-alanine carboxypeptidase
MWHGIKLGFFVLVVVLLLAYSSGDFSSASPTIENKTPSYQVDETSSLTGSAYIVFDVETGEVLLENRSSEVLPIASVTKLFTAVAMNKRDLLATTTISYQDTWAEEDFGKLRAGEDYQLRELLFPLLLESSNDAAAHFERVTKGEVVSEMNQLVKEVGLKNTALADASGLSSNNVSTADDLARFLSYLHREESYILDITTLKQYVGPYTGWVNNNPVLGKDYQGGKHGYTEAAKRTGAVLFSETISGNKKTIGYVVLGSQSLAMDVSVLRDFVHSHIRFE